MKKLKDRIQEREMKIKDPKKKKEYDYCFDYLKRRERARKFYSTINENTKKSQEIINIVLEKSI